MNKHLVILATKVDHVVKQRFVDLAAYRRTTPSALLRDLVNRELENEL